MYQHFKKKVLIMQNGRCQNIGLYWVINGGCYVPAGKCEDNLFVLYAAVLYMTTYFFHCNLLTYKCSKPYLLISQTGWTVDS